MSTRTIQDVQLVVAPGEPDDPLRAKRFVLTWWELTPRCLWSFCHRNIGAEGRSYVGKAPHDPDVLALIGEPTDTIVFREEAT